MVRKKHKGRKPTSSERIRLIKRVLNGYRLPHGYEIKRRRRKKRSGFFI